MWYPILGGLFGLLIGVVGDFFYNDWLPVLLFGIMAGQILSQQKQLGQIKRQLRHRSQKEQVQTSELVSDSPKEPVQEMTPGPPRPAHAGTEQAGTEQTAARPLSATREPVVLPPQGFTSEQVWLTKSIERLKGFFSSGNVVTKIGIIILFFGAAFLLKYASQRHLIPIEFRLMGVFAAGLALLFCGWRLRDRKNAYSLLLQGGGIGILYLTIFTATRFYQLLPAGFTFVLMLCLVIGSCLLALLQNAKALAVTALVGGFLAPVLVSTTTGSHVTLFTYYALLNFGIVAIATRRAWRELNVIGFYFTFIIGAVWGGKYYQPQYFASTEPFLVLFFLFYVTIAVFYALRQPPKLKGFVDGTLVFALPVVCFGLQYGLVRNLRYGMALSALLLGLLYAPLAIFLWRRYQRDLRYLSEAFMAFAIVFGSLAFPLALDGRWTSAAWALEGAALIWVGVRQQRFSPRLFGMVLQAGSGLAFLLSLHGYDPVRAIFNSFFCGCLLISLAGLFSSWHLAKQGVSRFHGYLWEQQIGSILLCWGLLWWFGAILPEIGHFISPQNWSSAILGYVAISFILFNELARLLPWTQLGYSSLFQLPVMFLVFSVTWLWLGEEQHLFAGFGLPAWLLAFVSSYRALYCCESIWPRQLLRLWHLLSGWLLLGVICHEVWWLVAQWLQLPWSWHMCIAPLLLGIIVVLLNRMFRDGRSLLWPFSRFPRSYFLYGITGLLGFLCCWSLMINLYPADPQPLKYLPLLNPVELCQIAIGLCIVYCSVDNRYWRLPRLRRVLWTLSGGSLFLLLNAILARTVHFYFQVPYKASSLFHSDLLQAAMSLLWGFLALVMTVLATRRQSRMVWVIGTSVLALVVIKLFLVDLASLGTFTRIISFIGVGSLMLLIGYFSPLPPAQRNEENGS